MDEHRDPQTNTPDEGELLAAYLDADTDDITAARVERLLRQDAQAAARLDSMARARARLQRLDDVEPPEGFRERLQARLQAERADDELTPVTDSEVADRVAVPQARPAEGRKRRWLAPLTTAAALVLVAVIGAAALLNQSSVMSSDDSAAAPADLQAESGEEAAEAPMAQDDAGAERAEEADGGAAGAGEAAGAHSEAAGATDEFSGSAIPRVTGDARLAAHLRRLADASEDPYAREFEQRERAGLPTAPMCISAIDEMAADLVEFNERLVVAALIDGDGGRRVVLYDAQSCERLRTFAAE